MIKVPFILGFLYTAEEMRQLKGSHSSLIQFFFDINLFILFIYFWLCWVSVAATFSSCREWGLLFVAVHGLLIAVASLVAEHGLQVHGLQQLWLAGSRAQAQQLWLAGLVAPWHVQSSRTRDQTRVPCLGRQILNHCTTREVLYHLVLKVNFYCL